MCFLRDTNYLFEKHLIAALPGTNFGRKPEELSLRFAYIDFNGSPFIDQQNKLTEEYVLSNCQKLLEGIKKLRKITLKF